MKGILLLSATWLLASCAGLGDVPAENVLLFDAEGYPLNPTPSWFGGHKQLDRHEYEAHLDGILSKLEEYGRECSDSGKPKRALLFIHGGLNSRSKSLRRAVELTHTIREDGTYPIFICWDSSLWSSYFDHLFFIRQGENWGAWGLLLTPVYLVGDLVTVVARVPMVWYSEVKNAIGGIPGSFVPSQALARSRVLKLLRDARSRLHPGEPADQDTFSEEDVRTVLQRVDWGEDYRTWPENLWGGFQWLLTLPTKLATGPVLSGVGSSAWDMMQRRIYLLFIQERELTGADRPTLGGIPQFCRRLRQFQQGNPDFEIVLVGHSMGCMVSLGILTIPDTPVFSRIVFMAPAAQIEGALRGLNSYMARHEETRCHILTLHEKAEVAEKRYAGLPPRGSLLVWIDDFLARPLTPLQHTSGRFTNALTMSYLFLPEVEDRVSLKAFSVGWNAPEGNPQTHGEFAKLPFWNEEFWQPRRTLEP